MNTTGLTVQNQGGRRGADLFYPALFEHRHHGAPIGEGRLEQIKPHESGKPQPVVAYKMRQKKTRQDQRARHASQNSVHTITSV